MLENSDFYSKGKKKEYWVHKAGKQTHRDMLRRMWRRRWPSAVHSVKLNIT